MIDLESGQIIEFRNAALGRIKAKIAKKYGYRIDDCHIEFYAYPDVGEALAANTRA